MITDRVGDFIIRLKNAGAIGNKTTLVPYSKHLDLLTKNGFRVVHSDLLRRVDGLSREKFDGYFRGMSHLDATTSMAAIICVRATDASPEGRMYRPPNGAI